MSESPSQLSRLDKVHDRLGSMIDQIGQPDYSLRELVDGLREVRDELFTIARSEKGMSAEEIDRVVSDLGRVAGVGDLYDRALGAIGDLRQQHASNDAATDKLIDALVAMVERNGGKMVNLPGWDGVSLAFHEHPRSHVERNAADSNVKERP
jgi:hypothetical protein